MKSIFSNLTAAIHTLSHVHVGPTVLAVHIVHFVFKWCIQIRHKLNSYIFSVYSSLIFLVGTNC